MQPNKNEPLIIGTDSNTGQEVTLWDKKGGRVIGAAAMGDDLKALLNRIAGKCRSEGVALVLDRPASQKRAIR